MVNHGMVLGSPRPEFKCNSFAHLRFIKTYYWTGRTIYSFEHFGFFYTKDKLVFASPLLQTFLVLASSQPSLLMVLVKGLAISAQGEYTKYKIIQKYKNTTKYKDTESVLLMILVKGLAILVQKYKSTKVQETKIQKYYKKLMNLVKGLAQGE